MSAAIQNLGKRLQSLAHQATQLAQVEVDDIIETGDQNQHRINHQLDLMLDFCFDPAMLVAFKQLCRYYFTINPVATAEHVHAYRDMWDTPDDLNHEEGA